MNCPKGFYISSTCCRGLFSSLFFFFIFILIVFPFFSKCKYPNTGMLRANVLQLLFAFGKQECSIFDFFLIFVLGFLFVCVFVIVFNSFSFPILVYQCSLIML